MLRCTLVVLLLSSFALAQGVTNAHGRTHEVPNLFISDGSVQTTAGAANPTLTIVALALRQAEHIGNEVTAGRL